MAWLHMARQWVRMNVAEAKWFDAIILALILASSVTLAMADPLASSDDELQASLAIADLVFLVLFTIEAVIKLFGLGLSKRCSQTPAKRGAGSAVRPVRISPAPATRLKTHQTKQTDQENTQTQPVQSQGPGSPLEGDAKRQLTSGALIAAPSLPRAAPLQPVGPNLVPTPVKSPNLVAVPPRSTGPRPAGRRRSVFEVASGPLVDSLEVTEDKGYFDSPWNWLDFIIVISGYLEFVPGVPEGPAGAVRMLRSLRPLRTINRLRGLKIIVTTLFTSFGDLAQVGVLVLFLWVIFSIAAVQLFQGIQHQRCSPPAVSPTPNLDPVAGTPDLDYAATLLNYCSPTAPVASLLSNSTTMRDSDSFSLPFGQCPAGTTCQNAVRDPWFGLASYDNFFLALLNIYVVTSLANWAQLMYMTFDPLGPATFIFYLLLTLLTSFFAINLVVAVILDRFERATDDTDRNDMDGSQAAQAEDLELALEAVRTGRLLRIRERAVHSRAPATAFASSQPPQALARDSTASGPVAAHLPAATTNAVDDPAVVAGEEASSLARDSPSAEQLAAADVMLSEEAKHTLALPVRLRAGNGFSRKRGINMTDLAALAKAKKKLLRFRPTKATIAAANGAEGMGSGDDRGADSAKQSTTSTSTLPSRSRWPARTAAEPSSPKSTPAVTGSSSPPRLERRVESPVLPPRSQHQIRGHQLLSSSSSPRNAHHRPLAPPPSPSSSTPRKKPAAPSRLPTVSTAGESSAAAPKAEGEPDEAAGDDNSVLSDPESRLLNAMMMVQRADLVVMTRMKYLENKPAWVLWLNRVVQQQWFSMIIITAIIGNTIVLALDRYGMSAGEAFALEAINAGLSFLFALEMVMKVIGLGPREYASDGFNVFDAVIVISSLAEMAVVGLPVAPADGNALASNDGGGVLSVFRAFRLLRVLKLAKSVKSIRTLLLAILESLPDVGWMTLLLILFLFLFSVLARQLFAGAVGNVANAGISFDSFLSSALAVLQVVTGDDYPTAMAAAAEATSGWAVAYFLILQSFGAYIVISLFVAVLLARLGAQTDEALDDSDFFEQALDLRIKGLLSEPGEQPRLAHPLAVAEAVAQSMLALYDSREQQVKEKRRKARLGVGGTGKDSDDEDGVASTTYPGPTTQLRSEASTPSSAAGRAQGDSLVRTDSRDALGTDVEASIGSDTILPLGSSHSAAVVERPSDRDMTDLADATGGTGARRQRQEGLIGEASELRLNSTGHGSSISTLTDLASDQGASSRPLTIQSRVTSGRSLQNQRSDHDSAVDTSSSTGQPVAQPEGEARPAVGWAQGAEFRRGSAADSEVSGTEAVVANPWGKGVDPPTGMSLGCLSPTNPIRVGAYVIANSASFEAAVLLLIGVSCVLLALDSPDLDRTSDLAAVISTMDVVFAVLFSIEALIKIVAYGAVTGPAPTNKLNQPQGYFRNAWNVIDALAVLFAVLSLALPDVSALRALRAVRPLRVVVRSPQIRMVLRALFAAIPSIANVTVLTLLLWTIFAILGVSLYKGQLSFCSDAAIDNKVGCTGNFTNGEGDMEVREWGPEGANFDSYGAAMLSLFQASTLSDWASMARVMMGARGVDVSPGDDESVFGLLFMACFVIVGSWLCLQLFTGVVIDRFSQLRKELDGSAFQTEKQRRWANTRKLLRAVNLEVRNDPPTFWLRNIAFRIVRHPYFDVVIITVILLNTLAMMLVHHNQGPVWTAVLDGADWVFLTIFTVEAVLKLAGLGLNLYFKDSWNRFDFIVVLGSYVTLFFDAGASAPVLRVVRIGRMLRLIRKARTLHNLFQTLVIALPSLYNVGGLLFILFFIFSVLGMSVCGGAPLGHPDDEGISRYANFRNFPLAMITLYRVSTNDAWEGLLASCRAASDGPVAEAIVTMFFILFLLIVSMSMLQLLIAVVIETFTERQEADVQETSLERVQLWSKQWNDKFDPTAERWIPVSLLAMLQCESPSPFGFATSELSRTEVQRMLNRVRIPIQRRPKRLVLRFAHKFMARRYGELQATAAQKPVPRVKSTREPRGLTAFLSRRVMPIEAVKPGAGIWQGTAHSRNPAAVSNLSKRQLGPQTSGRMASASRRGLLTDSRDTLAGRSTPGSEYGTGQQPKAVGWMPQHPDKPEDAKRRGAKSPLRVDTSALPASSLSNPPSHLSEATGASGPVDAAGLPTPTVADSHSSSSGDEAPASLDGDSGLDASLLRPLLPFGAVQSRSMGGVQLARQVLGKPAKALVSRKGRGGRAVDAASSSNPWTVSSTGVSPSKGPRGSGARACTTSSNKGSGGAASTDATDDAVGLDEAAGVASGNGNVAKSIRSSGSVGRYPPGALAAASRSSSHASFRPGSFRGSAFQGVGDGESEAGSEPQGVAAAALAGVSIIGGRRVGAALVLRQVPDWALPSGLAGAYMLRYDDGVGNFRFGPVLPLQSYETCGGARSALATLTRKATVASKSFNAKLAEREYAEKPAPPLTSSGWIASDSKLGAASSSPAAAAAAVQSGSAGAHVTPVVAHFPTPSASSSSAKHSSPGSQTAEAGMQGPAGSTGDADDAEMMHETGMAAILGAGKAAGHATQRGKGIGWASMPAVQLQAVSGDDAGTEMDGSVGGKSGSAAVSASSIRRGSSGAVARSSSRVPRAATSSKPSPGGSGMMGGDHMTAGSSSAERRPPVHAVGGGIRHVITTGSTTTVGAPRHDLGADASGSKSPATASGIVVSRLGSSGLGPLPSVSDIASSGSMFVRTTSPGEDVPMLGAASSSRTSQGDSQRGSARVTVASSRRNKIEGLKLHEQGSRRDAGSGGAAATPRGRKRHGGVHSQDSVSLKKALWVVEFDGALHALAKVVIGLRTSAQGKSKRQALQSRTFYSHEWFAVETVGMWWVEIKRRRRYHQ